MSAARNGHTALHSPGASSVVDDVHVCVVAQSGPHALWLPPEDGQVGPLQTSPDAIGRLGWGRAEGKPPARWSTRHVVGTVRQAWQAHYLACRGKPKRAHVPKVGTCSNTLACRGKPKQLSTPACRGKPKQLSTPACRGKPTIWFYQDSTRIAHLARQPAWLHFEH